MIDQPYSDQIRRSNERAAEIFGNTKDDLDLVMISCVRMRNRMDHDIVKAFNEAVKPKHESLIDLEQTLQNIEENFKPDPDKTSGKIKLIEWNATNLMIAFLIVTSLLYTTISLASTL